jgi:predicted nicotinamide N-methyase
MQLHPELKIFTINNHSIQLYAPGATGSKLSVHSPYWAKVWPAALGLCYFLHDNVHYVKHKTVTELAAGLGLPSLFAARYAAKVYCSDIEPAAVALLEQSVQHNRFNNVRCSVKSWSDYLGGINPHTLLLSDINYEPEYFDSLLEVIQYYLEHRCTVIISTPQRLMAKSFIEKLLLYCVHQEEKIIHETRQETAVSIFVLKLEVQA